MKFIVMNEEQAASVVELNASDSVHILMPIKRMNGKYILQASILEDSRYLAYKSILSSLPQLEDTDLDFPAETPSDID